MIVEFAPGTRVRLKRVKILEKVPPRYTFLVKGTTFYGDLVLIPDFGGDVVHLDPRLVERVPHPLIQLGEVLQDEL